MKDMGGRRRLADRRQYVHQGHFPECRAIRFRRREGDRRKEPATSLSRGFERRDAFAKQIQAVA